MEAKKNSPRVRRLSWGRVEVEGESGFHKDAKLYPGGSREWDWRETGTSHEAGIQPDDVRELLEQGAKVIILSQGFYGRLTVSPQTLDFLRKKGIEVHVEKTEEAVRLYNELAENGTVGALIHSTC